MASLKTKGGGKIVGYILMGFVMLGLVGFGATNFGGSASVVAEVGETKISANEYYNAVTREMNSVGQRFGTSLTMEQAQAFGLDRTALERLVNQAALVEEARATGLSVGDAQVQREILTQPAFQGLDGTFDREGYEATLRRAGQTVTDYEARVRADIATGLLSSAVSRGVTVPASYTEIAAAYALEARTLAYVHLNDTDLASPLEEPTEAVLRAHYEANAGDFTLPEAKRITYAWLAPEAMADGIAVDEAELRAAYEARADAYNQPERRLVERLVFGTTEEAEAAAAAIAASETDFDAVVLARGLTLADVDMGDMAEGDLGPAGAAVFAAEALAVVGPVETDLGPALFRVNGILAATSVGFDEVREELAAEARADAARRAVADQIEPINDALAGGATLEDLVAELGLELGTVDWSAQAESGIAAYGSFAEAAAAVSADDYPEVISMEDGGVFALRLDEIVPPRQQPYEDVTVAVIQSWAEAETTTRLTAQAETLAGALAEGGDFAALAGEAGYRLETTPAVTRDDYVDDTVPGLIEALFALEDGASEIIATPSGVALIQMQGIAESPIEADEIAALKRAYADSLDQAIAQDLLIAYVEAIQASAGITINQGVINGVNAQIP